MLFTRSVQSLPGELGIISGSNVWLFATEKKCWVHETYLATYIPNIAQKLQYCAPPIHQVGSLYSQYSRQDCYSQPSLDSPSQNLGGGRQVTVACKAFGAVVNGNA
jgi:hypothetical protein